MRAALLSLTILAAACGGGPVDAADLPVARLSGEVCRVPLLAGAVVVDDGLVLTAAHVLAGAEGRLVIELPSAQQFPGVVVGFDPERDLALLAAPALDASPIELGAARPGTKGAIVTLSREGRLESIDFEVNREITATGEDVVGGDGATRRALELSADVTRGISGGGAFDDDGRLLGIVFAESRERPITYAVTASEIESFLAEADPTTEVATGQC